MNFIYRSPKGILVNIWPEKLVLSSQTWLNTPVKSLLVHCLKLVTLCKQNDCTTFFNHPVGIYLYKINNRNTITMYKLYSRMFVWCLCCWLWTDFIYHPGFSITGFGNTGWVYSISLQDYLLLDALKGYWFGYYFICN